jgi:hypothetical protein
MSSHTHNIPTTQQPIPAEQTDKDKENKSQPTTISEFGISEFALPMKKSWNFLRSSAFFFQTDQRQKLNRATALAKLGKQGTKKPMLV